MHSCQKRTRKIVKWTPVLFSSVSKLRVSRCYIIDRSIGECVKADATAEPTRTLRELTSLLHTFYRLRTAADCRVQQSAVHCSEENWREQRGEERSEENRREEKASHSIGGNECSAAQRSAEASREAGQLTWAHQLLLLAPPPSFPLHKRKHTDTHIVH